MQIKKQAKRNLLYFASYNEDEDKNKVIVINKWYWLGLKKLTQMDQVVVKFIEDVLSCKEEKPCVYYTKLNLEEIDDILSTEGLKKDVTLSSVRID